MTLDGAVRDEVFIIEKGILYILPFPDASGRTMLWYNVSNNDFDGYSNDDFVSVFEGYAVRFFDHRLRCSV